jgi:hypothetical protein
LQGHGGSSPTWKWVRYWLMNAWPVRHCIRRLKEACWSSSRSRLGRRLGGIWFAFPNSPLVLWPTSRLQLAFHSLWSLRCLMLPANAAVIQCQMKTSETMLQVSGALQSNYLSPSIVLSSTRTQNYT